MTLRAYIIGGLALVCAGLGVTLYATLTTSAATEKALRSERDAETRRADTNATTVQALIQSQAEQETLAREVRALRDRLDRRLTSITDTIANAPPELDGSVSPVLRDTLNSLHDLSSEGGGANSDKAPTS